MKKVLHLLALCLSVCGFAQSSYYNNVDITLTGNNLFDELSDLVTDTHDTYLSYTPGVWETLQEADQNPYNSSEIILIYGYDDNDNDDSNDRTRSASAIDSGGTSSSDYWNREHVFAKSLGNPDLGTTGAGADAHHIRPADPSMNSTRNNRKFADGSGDSGITSQGYWYPGDEWKGDVARMIMYTYIRYQTQCIPSAVGVGSSVSTDSNMIDLFLEWNVDDPVSDIEILRNDAIEDAQGNRNPFIDNPAFATSIWGGEQAEDLFGDTTNDGGSTTSDSDLIISEYVEGSSYNKAIEIANISNSSVSLSNYSLKRDTNGSGTWSTELALSGTLSSGGVYVIAHSSASSSIDADLATSSTVMTFNGNDPVGLFYNDTLVDIVGTFGGGSSNFAINTTLVRDTDATATTSYNSSQWTAYDSDTFDYLGSYNSTGSGGESGSSTTASQLYISEYVEGSSYNKAIEIANYTGSSVNLSNYSIKRDLNGSGSWSTAYTLSGTLTNGEVVVVAHSSSSVNADFKTTATAMTFNGNDPVGLFYNDTLIDIVGTFGGGSSNFAMDTTLVRNSSITDPSTTYNSNQWSSYNTDTFSYLGNHNTSSKTVTDDTSASVGMFTITNPATTNILFKGLNENASYAIYNGIGALVKKGSIEDNIISVIELTNGYYFLKVIDATNNNITTKTFIKK